MFSTLAFLAFKSPYILMEAVYVNMHKCQENAKKLYMELRLVVGSQIGKQTKQSQIPSQNDNYLFFLSFGFHVQLTNERVSSMIPSLIQNPYSCERADFHLTFCNAIVTVL